MGFMQSFLQMPYHGASRTEKTEGKNNLILLVIFEVERDTFVATELSGRVYGDFGPYG